MLALKERVQKLQSDVYHLALLVHATTICGETAKVGVGRRGDRLGIASETLPFGMTSDAIAGSDMVL